MLSLCDVTWLSLCDVTWLSLCDVTWLSLCVVTWLSLCDVTYPINIITSIQRMPNLERALFNMYINEFRGCQKLIVFILS